MSILLLIVKGCSTMKTLWWHLLLRLLSIVTPRTDLRYIALNITPYRHLPLLFHLLRLSSPTRFLELVIDPLHHQTLRHWATLDAVVSLVDSVAFLFQLF